jgi:hypothetical protein
VRSHERPPGAERLNLSNLIEFKVITGCHAFADLLGDASGAALVVAGGFALEIAGIVAVAVGAAALPALAAVWILLAPARAEPVATEAR